MLAWLHSTANFFGIFLFQGNALSVCLFQTKFKIRCNLFLSAGVYRRKVPAPLSDLLFLGQAPAEIDEEHTDENVGKLTEDPAILDSRRARQVHDQKHDAKSQHDDAANENEDACDFLPICLFHEKYFPSA